MKANVAPGFARTEAPREALVGLGSDRPGHLQGSIGLPLRSYRGMVRLLLQGKEDRVCAEGGGLFHVDDNPLNLVGRNLKEQVSAEELP
jgi:hypothetical protein